MDYELIAKKMIEQGIDPDEASELMEIVKADKRNIDITAGLAEKMSQAKKMWVAKGNLGEKDAEDRIRMVAKADPTGDAASYVIWLVKMDIAKEINFPEDTEQIRELLKSFDTKKKSSKFPSDKKDIMQYQNPGQLSTMLNSLSPEAMTGPEYAKRIAPECIQKAVALGAEVMGENNGYKVVKSTTTEQFHALCPKELNDKHFITWCVCREDSFTRDYLATGPLFLFFKNGQYHSLVTKKGFRGFEWRDVENVSLTTEVQRDAYYCLKNFCGIMMLEHEPEGLEFNLKEALEKYTDVSKVIKKYAKVMTEEDISFAIDNINGSDLEELFQLIGAKIADNVRLIKKIIDKGEELHTFYTVCAVHFDTLTIQYAMKKGVDIEALYKNIRPGSMTPNMLKMAIENAQAGNNLAWLYENLAAQFDVNAIKIAIDRNESMPQLYKALKDSPNMTKEMFRYAIDKNASISVLITQFRNLLSEDSVMEIINNHPTITDFLFYALRPDKDGVGIKVTEVLSDANIDKAIEKCAQIGCGGTLYYQLKGKWTPERIKIAIKNENGKGFKYLYKEIPVEMIDDEIVNMAKTRKDSFDVLLARIPAKTTPTKVSRKSKTVTEAPEPGTEKPKVKRAPRVKKAV